MVQPKSSLIVYYPHIQTLIDLPSIGANFNSKFSLFMSKVFAKFNQKKKKKLANLVELALENQENEKKNVNFFVEFFLKNCQKKHL